MKKLITLAIFLTTTSAYAAQTCKAQKSVMWVDSNNKYHSRIAQTKPFSIVATEHETPYKLEFIDKDGIKWDEVEIMTGTLLKSTLGDVFQVNANITKPNGEIISYLALVADIESKFSRAVTIIDLPDTDFDPSMSIECKLSSF